MKIWQICKLKTVISNNIDDILKLKNLSFLQVFGTTGELTKLENNLGNGPVFPM